MPGIQTGIELHDQFSSVLNGIIGSVNLAVSAMYDMQEGMNADIDTRSLEGAREEINQATAALKAMNEALSRQAVSVAVLPADDALGGHVINVDVNPILPEPLVENPEPIRTEIQPNAPPAPVEVPVVWQSDGLEVFTGTGMDRFRQEVQSANSMLEQIRMQMDRMVQEQNEQGRFNQTVAEGAHQANGLTNMIRNASAAYVSIRDIGKALDISDSLVQTIARLGIMNDEVKCSQELVNMVYTAAQALSASKPAVTYPAGEYYVYKVYNGAVNVTRSKGKAGAWVVL